MYTESRKNRHSSSRAWAQTEHFPTIPLRLKKTYNGADACEPGVTHTIRVSHRLPQYQSHTMSEHHTQGRQGQGARRRRNQGRHRRQRMPRPSETPKKKPSLLARILSFFGFRKKEKADFSDKRNERGRKNTPPQKVRIAKTNNKNGNPAAKGRRRATSTPPTRNARLYVGNLSYEATEAELEDLFKGFGNVKSVEVIYNPRTFKSKGYAFVEMYKLEEARKAAEVLHGQPFMGRELMVSAASERPEQSDTPKPQNAEAPATEQPVEEVATTEEPTSTEA